MQSVLPIPDSFTGEARRNLSLLRLRLRAQIAQLVVAGKPLSVIRAETEFERRLIRLARKALS